MTPAKLKLYNTLTRDKQDFVPIDPMNVGMYVCGVTPYDDSHIGHARAYVVFDVLYRLLRHVYGENHVTYVRNFTDIDDKIIQRAQELGVSPTEVSEKNIASFYEDMDALNILRPDVEPRVSTSILGIIQMIDELVAAGYAYVTPSGDVMYRTRKFPRFGELARRKLDEQQHGSRVAEDDEKESPNDFVLWKANAKSATKMEQAFVPAKYRDNKSAEPYNAPGRPGWHIECSVMSREHLGPTFDIHGGGEDLQFPHHSCEIAQSEALLPAGQQMARFWLHNGFITVNGTKMSKSLGNFTTIKNALEKYSPEAIRLWLLQTHYRKPVDYSDEALTAAENRVDRIIKNYIGIYRANDTPIQEIEDDTKNLIDNIKDEFLAALLDDLNTAQALGILSKIIKLGEEISEQDLPQSAVHINDTFKLMMGILGINWDLQNYKSRIENKPLSVKEELLLEVRAAARLSKNWQASDDIRDVLKTEHGIIVEDGPNGQTWRRV